MDNQIRNPFQSEILSDKFWSLIEPELETISSKSEIASSILSAAVKKLSDYYIENPSSETPWDKTWAKLAYLCYYFPLNLVRAQAVFKRIFHSHLIAGKAFHFENVIDFGAGLGSGSLPLLLTKLNFRPRFLFIERSTEASRIHGRILQGLLADQSNFEVEWSTQLPDRFRPRRKTLGIFSYSLTELSELPSWSDDLDALVIIEPSTSEDGRSLMAKREELISRGWKVQAPCTHQHMCPLLHESKHDWCHDRLHWSKPQWLTDIEEKLPFKNVTLTYSYLYATKDASQATAPESEVARLVGDSVQEKGKVRQLVCRGPEREFLTWMERHGKFEPLPRGELIEWPKEFEKKSNEIRLKANPKLL